MLRRIVVVGASLAGLRAAEALRGRGFDGDLTLTRRTVAVAAAYDGAVALKSFDPAVVGSLRGVAPDMPRGIIAKRATTAANGEA